MSTGWGYQFNSHCSFTTTPVSMTVFHQKLVRENTRKVECSRAFHIPWCMRRPQRHSYEVFFCEGEGTDQFNTLGPEGFDRVMCAGSDLVNAVSPYLVVLHEADFQVQSGVCDAGACTKVFAGGYPNLKGDTYRVILAFVS